MPDVALVSVDLDAPVVPVVAVVLSVAVVAEVVVTDVAEVPAVVCPLPSPAQATMHAARARHRKIIANFFIIKFKIPFLVF